MGIDSVTVLVDHHMVVEPAEEPEVVRVVVASVAALPDVVGFEAVATGAAVCGARAGIPVVDVVADAVGDAVPVGADCS